jgi:Prokaryotic Cytochrome C oxidase subunit IV
MKMKLASNKRLFIVWLVLVAITLLYLWIDHSVDKSGVLRASGFVTVVAICFACVKVRIIMREFMEVRGAPPLLCRITDVWVVFIAVALIATYVAGRVVA